MKLRSISTAALLLAGWAAASVSCSDNADHSQPRSDAAVVTDGGNAGADASSTSSQDAAPAGSDAAMKVDATTAAGDASMHADASARVDASMDGSTSGATKWWEAATWTRLSWLPSTCVVSLLDDPSQIPALQWEPLALANLMGATPVAPGWTYYTYQELDDGTSWVRATVSGESIVAVRDKAGAGLFAYKSSCVEASLASTSRGVCVHFGFRNDDRGVVACGDLRHPKPMLEIARFGFVYASSDELIMIKKDRDDYAVFIVDVVNESVHDTKLTGSFQKAAAHGHDAFTIQLTTSSALPQRGIIYNWDGATGYKMIRDPAPLGVINVHAAAGQLVWTETEVEGLRSGTSIYRAPWPPSGATLSASLVRKVTVFAIYDESALAAGQLAVKGSDRVELINLDDAKRHTVTVGKSWNVSAIYLNDRSLVIRLVDSATASKYTSFRANLSDVLALPAD